MRTSKDVTIMMKAAAAYVLMCYRCRDPNFNLETIREGVTTTGPTTMERLEMECQGSEDFVGLMFQVETIEEAVEEE